jgi:hypothetical protein
VLTAFDLIRVLGLVLSVTICAAIVARALADALTTQGRMLRVAQSRSDLLRWADQGEYALLFHEAVRGGLFCKNRHDQVVYRVVIRNQGGALRQGWVACGGPLEVMWEDRLSFAPSPTLSNDPLWDRELDA